MSLEAGWAPPQPLSIKDEVALIGWRRLHYSGLAHLLLYLPWQGLRVLSWHKYLHVLCPQYLVCSWLLVGTYLWF